MRTLWAFKIGNHHQLENDYYRMDANSFEALIRVLAGPETRKRIRKIVSSMKKSSRNYMFGERFRLPFGAFHQQLG